MAEPARRFPPAEEPHPIDPGAVERAYRRHRAARRARVERRRQSRYAGVRFWIGLALLLAASVVLALTIWREIERLFGL